MSSHQSPSVQEHFVEPLLGELRQADGVFPGGYTLAEVTAGASVELLFRGASDSVRLWLRPLDGTGGAYRRTAHFRVGYQGELGGAQPLLEAVCQAVTRNEGALFAGDGVTPCHPLPWDESAAPTVRPPPWVLARRSQGEVLCTQPWTTLEVTDPSGAVHQCCADWTVGDRGNLADAPLAELWNGAPYQAARRAMARAETEGLCRPRCPRLHDRGFAESRLEIAKGSAAFMENQRLLLEELAERREILRARPLFLALCPSTYCNYDCVMCTYGRTPRRELPEAIWAQVDELLPTLHTLTLLGGEPLASPATMDFLRGLDARRYPDLRVDLITNGSLLTEKALAHLGRCPFGDLTISLNAGTAPVYEAVQRGVSLDEVLRNVDALIAMRSRHPRPFQVTLSFVVQPLNVDTLPAFGELARRRGLRMRLLPLSPLASGELDFYRDSEEVARVLDGLARFAVYASEAVPEWLTEISGTRAAIVAEAERRTRAEGVQRPSQLPVVR